MKRQRLYAVFSYKTVTFKNCLIIRVCSKFQFKDQVNFLVFYSHFEQIFKRMIEQDKKMNGKEYTSENRLSNRLSRT